MERSKTFSAEREPLRHADTVQLSTGSVYGPLSFLNPTQAHLDPVVPGAADADTQGSYFSDTSIRKSTIQADDLGTPNIKYRWTSRNNRKGRHALVIRSTNNEDGCFRTPPPTNELKQILKGAWRMFTCFPVINGFFTLLPLTNPKSEFPRETLFGGGITAFIGCMVFEIGCILLVLEAVNENRSGCFGWAVEQLYEVHARRHSHELGIVTHIVPDEGSCMHHHQNVKNVVGKQTERALTNIDQQSTTGVANHPSVHNGIHTWIWFPSSHDLSSHYMRELGFLACFVQLLGMTVFCIAGLTALPPIYSCLDTKAKLNGAFWIPQVIGGIGFTVSGTLFLIETQSHWWQPAPSMLGWHIAAWYLVGGVGFTLCPIFGMLTAVRWAEYQVACSTFWGSWAFLIASVIQWYESLNKHPVEQEKAA